MQVSSYLRRRIDQGDVWLHKVRRGRFQLHPAKHKSMHNSARTQGRNIIKRDRKITRTYSKHIHKLKHEQKRQDIHEHALKFNPKQMYRHTHKQSKNKQVQPPILTETRTSTSNQPPPRPKRTRTMSCHIISCHVILRYVTSCNTW